MRLYPKIQITGQSFVGSPVMTVPNQSMTLKDIIQRFIRREALPLAHNVMYAENLGDLEKLAYADITVQMEKAAWIKDKLSKTSYYVSQDGSIEEKPTPTSAAPARHQTESSHATSNSQTQAESAGGKGAASAPV